MSEQCLTCQNWRDHKTCPMCQWRSVAEGDAYRDGVWRALGVFFTIGTLVFVLVLIVGCATVPEQKIVTEVKSLPPVSVPVPVRCVKEIPALPNVTIDPNATVLQRYYAMRALIAAQDEALLRQNAVIVGCAADGVK